MTFGGPALPSLIGYRPGVDAELLRHPGHDTGMDFGGLWKPPVRSEEKQQDGKGRSIGLALPRNADMILLRERPCVGRIFRIVRWLAHGFLIQWVRVLITR